MCYRNGTISDHGVTKKENRTLWVFLANHVQMQEDILGVIAEVVHMHAITFAQPMTNWNEENCECSQTANLIC
jgi:hypothetical protein